MKKHFILKTSVIALALIILMQISAFAYNITLNLSTDNSTYEVGKEVTLTVKWGEKQQAVGFAINYDATKVKFVSSPDIANTFYNTTEAGKVDVNWASMDGKEPTQMAFKFTTLAEGEVEFTITGADKDKFSDGNLEAPEALDASNAKAKITIAKPADPAPSDPTPSDPTPSNPTPSDPTPSDPTPSDPTPSNPTQQPEDGKTEQKPTTGTTNKVDNTIAGGKMPQTGAETTIFFVIGTVALIGIIGFKKYRSLSDI